MMITKITQMALRPPERSWLRKMSENTMINSQIQMKNKKNQSMDRKTCPVPKFDATRPISTTPLQLMPVRNSRKRSRPRDKCEPREHIQASPRRG